ncbi:hypothetical protein WJX81_005979 [Elliptochloris bilobata]|uniref:Uncharacterized protein n=1 Tax=Elliptochloris bilobata TaxID=381761 RepID=A0AAW1QHR4_9CHLO
MGSGAPAPSGQAAEAAAAPPPQALPTHTRLLYGGLVLGGALAFLPGMGLLYMAWAGLHIAAGVANLIGKGLVAGAAQKRRGPKRPGHRGGRRERRSARGHPFMGDPEGLYPESHRGDVESEEEEINHVPGLEPC